MQTEWVAKIVPPDGHGICAAASGKGGLDAQLRDAVRESRQPGCNRRYSGSPRRPASGRPGEPARAGSEVRLLSRQFPHLRAGIEPIAMSLEGIALCPEQAAIHGGIELDGFAGFD